MSKRILVTGSSGTIGTALTILLRELGYDVIPTDIRASVWDRAIDKKTVRFDLRKTIPPKRFGKPPDMIVHLAANARVHDLVLHPEKGMENYLMTFNVLEYARTTGVQRILFSSSREVYGETTTQSKRNEKLVTPELVLSPYTASKLGSEGLLHAYGACYELKPVIVRLSNVYGRYDVSERVVPLFLYNALRNRDIVVFGKEKQLDFTWIDDVTDGLSRIIAQFDSHIGDTFNIASGKGERIADIALRIIKLTGSRSKIKVARKRTGEISHFIGDITNAKRSLGYAPNVMMNEGLKRSFEWYQTVTKEKKVAAFQKDILRPLKLH